MFATKPENCTPAPEGSPPTAARLRQVAGTKWGTRRYLDMDRLRESAGAAWPSITPRPWNLSVSLRRNRRQQPSDSWLSECENFRTPPLICPRARLRQQNSPKKEPSAR